jgi:hypothetical protein
VTSELQRKPKFFHIRQAKESAENTFMSVTLAESKTADFFALSMNMTEATTETSTTPNIETESKENELFGFLIGDASPSRSCAKSLERMPPGLLSPPLRTPLRSVCADHRRLIVK